MGDDIQQLIIDARRNQIITAAIAVIAEHGYQRATIRQIAQTAGVADGTIYNYFKNKEAILLAIIAHLTEAEVRDIKLAQTADIPPEQFLDQFVRQRTADIEANYQAFKALFPETITNDTLSQALNEQIYQPGFAVAEQYFARLMAEGRMKTADPALTARLFAAPLMGLLCMRLLGDDHIAQHWTQYTDAVINLLKTVVNTGETPNED